MPLPKHIRVLVPVVIITIACLLSRGSSAALLTGVAPENDPKSYKIDIEQDEILTLTVNECNMTGNCSVLAALALGMARNFGDTLCLTVAELNSTQNATITHTHVAQTPLYLIIYVLECGNNSLQYEINSSHPIVEYSYSEYYGDVVLPEVVPRIVFLAIALGFVALVITAYLIKRRRGERTAATK
nr:hypothetical protein [Candidatus Sigynarchaeota archaeon]